MHWPSGARLRNQWTTLVYDSGQKLTQEGKKGCIRRVLIELRTSQFSMTDVGTTTRCGPHTPLHTHKWQLVLAFEMASKGLINGLLTEPSAPLMVWHTRKASFMFTTNRTPDSLLRGQVRQERDGHDGLAQPHLVGQNAVEAAAVESHKPVQTDVLVLPQPMLQQERHLQAAESTSGQYAIT